MGSDTRTQTKNALWTMVRSLDFILSDEKPLKNFNQEVISFDFSSKKVTLADVWIIGGYYSSLGKVGVGRWLKEKHGGDEKQWVSSRYIWE